MPVGVQVSTAPPPAVSAPVGGDIRSYFVVGQAERGDTVAPVIVTSWEQAQDLLGARVTYGTLYDDLQTYFAELNGAPGRAVIARVVGGSAVKATLTLQDATPGNSIRVDAASEGSWGNNLTVQVVAGSQAGTFTLVIAYNGTEVERYRDLVDVATAVSQVNAQSGYVRLTNLGTNLDPAVLAATALTSGVNDSGAVTSSTLTAALARFSADLGPGVVAIPGQPYSAVAAALIAHGKSYNRIVLTAPASGTSVSAAGSAARGLRATSGSEKAAFVYPWIQIPDGVGGTRTISPEGFVAGRRGATIVTAGDASASAAPAGEAGVAVSATGVEKALTSDEINTLDADAVSSIRLYAGVPRLYGWRSLSLDETNYRFLTTSDLLNYFAYRCMLVLERYYSRSIDNRGHLFTQLANDLTAEMQPVADAGGLFARPDGNPPDPGYLVDVGATVNTDASIARGEVRAVVEFRDSPIAALIRLTLIKVPTASDL